MILKQKLEWYDVNGNLIFDSDDTTGMLKDINSVTVRRGLDSKSNVIDVKFTNPVNLVSSDSTLRHLYVDESSDLMFNEGDGFKFYAVYDTDNTEIGESDLLISADVLEWSGKGGEKTTQLSVKGTDKTYGLLNQVWAEAITHSKGLTAPEIVKRLVRAASDGCRGTCYGEDGSSTRTGFSIDARLESEGGYIEDERLNGSGFPVKSITKVWKPIYEWIEDLSTIEFTNSSSELDSGNPPANRKYVYYVDELNRFHWFYPNDSQNYTFSYGDDSGNFKITGYNLKKATYDTINLVFYNAGIDLNGVGILWYYYNNTSKDKKLKMKFKAYTEIGRDLRYEEEKEGNITINDDDSVTIVNSSGTTSWGESYTDESDYNDKFRLKCRYDADSRAGNLTNAKGSPRWKGSITFNGYNVLPGEVCEVTISPLGIKDQLIRIKDVTHQITKQSWDTTIDVEEDEAKTEAP